MFISANNVSAREKLQQQPRTRKRDVALVLASVSPLENRERLANRERPRWIFQRDDTLFVRRKFADIGVLLVLQFWTKRRGGFGEYELEAGESRIGYLQIHIAFELQVVQSAFAGKL